MGWSTRIAEAEETARRARVALEVETVAWKREGLQECLDDALAAAADMRRLEGLCSVPGCVDCARRRAEGEGA